MARVTVLPNYCICGVSWSALLAFRIPRSWLINLVHVTVCLLSPAVNKLCGKISPLFASRLPFLFLLKHLQARCATLAITEAWRRHGSQASLHPQWATTLPTSTVVERSSRISHHLFAACHMPSSFHEDVVDAMESVVAGALQQTIARLRWTHPRAAVELGRVYKGRSASIVLKPHQRERGLSMRSRSRARARMKKASRDQEVAVRSPDASFYRTPTKLPPAMHAMLTCPSQTEPSLKCLLGYSRSLSRSRARWRGRLRGATLATGILDALSSLSSHTASTISPSARELRCPSGGREQSSITLCTLAPVLQRCAGHLWRSRSTTFYPRLHYQCLLPGRRLTFLLPDSCRSSLTPGVVCICPNPSESMPCKLPRRWPADSVILAVSEAVPPSRRVCLLLVRGHRRSGPCGRKQEQETRGRVVGYGYIVGFSVTI